jgi:soluble lytic murein transglycosylase-like protein
MAREAGHDPALIVSIAEHESGLRADAVSPLNRDGTTRDYGLMQVNSQHLGKPGFPRTAAEALDPRVSLRAAFVLLNEAKRHWPGDVERQLAEYNGGYALAARGRPFPNQSYVHGVLARYALHTSESEIAV